MVIYVDKKSTFDLSKNPVFHGRSKHIDIRFQYIRDCIERGEILVKYVKTAEQKADQLTKPMFTQKFEEMRGLLGVKDLMK